MTWCEPRESVYCFILMRDRVDLLYTTRWGCKPCMVPIQSHQGPLASILREIAAVSTLIPGVLNSDGLIDFDTLETLQQISIAKANAAGLTLEERKTVSQVIYLVNHRLLTEVSDINDDVVSGFELCEAFWVAAVLYLHLMIREIPRRARIHYPLTKKLRVIINSKFSGQLVEGAALEYAIWIIFLGAAASPPEEDDSYFINLLMLISENLGIKEQGGLKARLRNVVWIDEICDPYLKVIWADLKKVAIREGTPLG